MKVVPRFEPILNLYCIWVFCIGVMCMGKEALSFYLAGLISGFGVLRGIYSHFDISNTREWKHGKKERVK